MAKLLDIPQMTQCANSYNVMVDWDSIDDMLTRYITKFNLEMDPDFQRGHVWTREQQIAYVEFKLRGGSGSDIILLNRPGWMQAKPHGNMVLVDGKQRLKAVMQFLANVIPVFGNTYFNDFEDNHLISKYYLRFVVNNLETRKEVLQWYLELNSGGTPHSKQEIERVTKLWESA